jgi:hypothetical protein
MERVDYGWIELMRWMARKRQNRSRKSIHKGWIDALMDGWMLFGEG